MTPRTRTDILLLAGFCTFLFFYGIAQFGLIGADEPRYAQVSREMLQRQDWITPTLGGRAWLEKPPLYYWQTMLVYSVLGVTMPRRAFLRDRCDFPGHCHLLVLS
jgi:4-amino-4-deoxy-L-arabinose transferase-like glycosyltransferase